MLKQRNPIFKYLLLIAAAFILQACAHHFPVPRETPLMVYNAQAQGQKAVHQWAPLFAAHGHREAYNRIGRPVVRGKRGKTDPVRIDIDPAQPTVYVMQRSFTTSRGTYLNLIYRVHFPQVPYSLVPFNLTAGRNVGLMVVISLNRLQQPVLVSTVHTCGCYKAVLPTDFLDAAAYPPDWQDAPLSVYGEELPPRLNFTSVPAPRLLVHLRPGVHRVMHLEVVSASNLDEARFAFLPMKMADMADLNRLPSADGPVSFYFQEGVLKGHVKGSFKPLETFLLGLVSLDFFVGSDKVYGDPKQWGNPFYTSLKPWRRKASDMWDFAAFLAYWGWRL